MLHYLHVLLVVTQQPDIDETLKAIFVEDFFFLVLKLKDAIFGTTFLVDLNVSLELHSSSISHVLDLFYCGII